jgi:hypothetical protein
VVGLGWVRGLSEKIAAEMGGNKDSGHDGLFLPPVSGEDDCEGWTWPHADGITGVPLFVLASWHLVGSRFSGSLGRWFAT